MKPSRALGHVTTGLPSDTAGEGDWRPRLHAVARKAFELIESLAGTALGTVLDAAVSASWSWEDGAGGQEMLQAVERAETIGAFAARWGI
ncbi:MAG: hypothetical protein ACOC7V_17385 [Spirochaetota bacterium]